MCRYRKRRCIQCSSDISEPKYTRNTRNTRQLNTRIRVSIYAHTRIDIRIYAYEYTHILVYTTYAYA